MIIGLTGLKGSGKDTIAAHLIKSYGFERRAFADKLKESAAALLKLDPSHFEVLKNSPDILFAIGSFKQDGMFEMIVNQSTREFLQRYGTESHRDVFGQDFWVNQLLPMDGFYTDRNIVITDVRFVNEAERIHALKGYVVRVVRTLFNAESDLHTSEQEQLQIKSDYELDNTGYLYELPKKIDLMMKLLAPDDGI
jgi:Deoxynucleotide monophosphate kinase